MKLLATTFPTFTYLLLTSIVTAIMQLYFHKNKCCFVNEGVTMTWEYALIGLIVGFIIGTLVVRFGNTKLHNQQALQAELKKKNRELEEYRKELVSNFACNTKLLDNMAQDYWQLYQHIAKSSHELMPDIEIQNNPFKYQLTESELNNDRAPMNLPPKDYSEASSGLFRSMKGGKR